MTAVAAGHPEPLFAHSAPTFTFHLCRGYLQDGSTLGGEVTPSRELPQKAHGTLGEKLEAELLDHQVEGVLAVFPVLRAVASGPDAEPPVG